MAQKICIFDTTLRDGEQSPGASMDTEDKLVIARQLLRLGVDIIEAGFPASSPGDLTSVSRIAEFVGDQAVVCALSRAIKRDIELAAQSLAPCARPRIQTGIGVSDVHLKEKLHMTRKDCLKEIAKSVSYAKTFVDDVQFYAEDAGRADLDFLAEAVRIAIESGATVVNVPDTTGFCLPYSYGARIAYLKEAVPSINDVVVAVHAHNDLGMATALALAGVAAGATQVECTLNGIGERAGNTALEEVVMAIKMHGDELDAYTDIQTTEIMRASRLLSTITGIAVQQNKAIVGANAFSHASGIHQDGVLKDPHTYEIIDPAWVGAKESALVLTARSGRAALMSRLNTLGYSFDSSELDDIYEAFLGLADKKKVVYDEDLESLINERVRTENARYQLESLQISCGFPLTPTATLTLRCDDGELRTTCEFGTGPIDAAYKAINNIVGVENDLVEFTVQSLTRGIDALGEVTVRVKAENGHIYIGRGSDGDIIVSAARAYLNALNRLLDDGACKISGKQM